MRSSALLAVAVAVAVFTVVLPACGDSGGDGGSTNDILIPTPRRDAASNPGPPARPDAQSDGGVGTILPDPDVVDDVDVDAGPAPTGAPCTRDRDCTGGFCLIAPDWPDGTCSSPRCDDEIPCVDEGAECVIVRTQSRCLAGCDQDEDCREGYRCADLGQGDPVCVPDSDILGRGDGAACDGAVDCASNLCLQGEDWPGGHCTTYPCMGDDSCASIDGPAACVLGRTGDNRCMRVCATNEDCRDGYICQPNGEQPSYCDLDVPVIVPPTADNSPLPIECGFASSGGRVEIPFEVPAGTRTFGLSAYAADGQPFVLGSVVGASGESASLTRYLFDSSWPVYAEVFGAGRFPSGLVPGEYRLVLQTSSTDVCLLAVSEAEQGEFLDINVYVLGVGSETWETLPQNPDWLRLIDHARTIFAGAGITLREVRYPPIPPGESVIIRSDSGVGAVSETYGQLPSDDADGTLSVDVFVTRGFAMGGVLGISPLTGSMGVHGLRWTGLAMTGEYLGAGPLPFSDAADSEQYLAMVMVHEIGHYLGLPHVGDTNNVMLPSAGVSHTQWNAAQIETMRSNPLTKVELVDPEGSGDDGM